MASRKGQKHRPWSAEDDRIYAENYRTMKYADLASLLGRSEHSTRNRRLTLGLPYVPRATQNLAWSEEQLDALCKLYEGPGPLELTAFAASIGKLKSNVCRKARELGLDIDPRRRRKLVRKIDLFPKKTREQIAFERKQRGAVVWVNNPHPRGMLGKKHSQAVKDACSERSRMMWMDPSSKWNSQEAAQRRSDQMMARNRSGTMNNGYTRCQGGKRSDLGDTYFRSSWEANYARYLNFMQQRGDVLWWDYEAHTFEFKKIKRGTRSYLPDFLVVRPSGRYEWHEVKGWMDQKSRTKLSRMAIYFPHETVVVIGKAWFTQANRGGLAGAIPNWERPKVSRQKVAA